MYHVHCITGMAHFLRRAILHLLRPTSRQNIQQGEKIIHGCSQLVIKRKGMKKTYCSSVNHVVSESRNVSIEHMRIYTEQQLKPHVLV